MLKDPQKMAQLQADVDKMLADPAKRQAMEQWTQQVQGTVDRLRSDPEMKAFFEDVEKNGVSAWQRYEKDERILRKFAEVSGGATDIFGPGGFPAPGFAPGQPAPGFAPGQPPTFRPGDHVAISGLKAKADLNGRQAIVVPPTAEEREALRGTGRVIVRLLDTGEQFAVKPDNLRSAAFAAAGGGAGGGTPAAPLAGVEDPSHAAFAAALSAEAEKLRATGSFEALQQDPELQPVLQDIRANGMGALEKYMSDERFMSKLSKAMGGAPQP